MIHGSAFSRVQFHECNFAFFTTEKVMQQKEISRLLTSLNITFTYEFVPFQNSRNRESDHLSMNYKVTMSVNGREVLTTDYMMGIGHCRSYKSLSTSERNNVYGHKLIKLECDTGMYHRRLTRPSDADVMYSLLMDSDALDYSDFKDWSECMGYDDDSIKARDIYNACLAIALKIRNAFSTEQYETLQQAFEEY